MKTQIEVTEIVTKFVGCKPDCEWCHGANERDGLVCPNGFEFVREEKKMVDVEFEPTADGGMRIKM